MKQGKPQSVQVTARWQPCSSSSDDEAATAAATPPAPPAQPASAAGGRQAAVVVAVALLGLATVAGVWFGLGKQCSSRQSLRWRLTPALGAGDDAPAAPAGGGIGGSALAAPSPLTTAAALQLRRAAAAMEPAPFYFFSPEEVEATYPALKACGLTVLAQRQHDFFATHPARVPRLQDAAFAVWPGYSAWEENWPHYGNQPANQARPGKQCFDESLQAALNAAARMRADTALLLNSGRGSKATPSSRGPRHLLVIDLFAWGWRADWAAYYDAADASGVVFAKLEPLRGGAWRPRLDVSVPPPAHHLAMPVAPLFNATPQELAAAAAWSSPLLEDKAGPPPALVNFKGRFSTHGVRAALGALNDPPRGALIVNSELPPEEQAAAVAGAPPGVPAGNFTALMAASAFTLAPRGHARWSYRYTEATCSGSVPVVVGTDGWRMPFDRLAPFAGYGLAVAEADAARTVEVLRAVPDATRRAMANAARRVCQRWLGSPERIAQGVLTELTLKLADLLGAEEEEGEEEGGGGGSGGGGGGGGAGDRRRRQRRRRRRLAA